MRKLVVLVGLVALGVNASAWAGSVGWEAFVIRNSSVGDIAPVITDTTGGEQFAITLGGQKAGWGTNSLNGMTIGDILSISITRNLPATTGNGPYMNFWVTDGHGQYADLAIGNLFDATWDVLKTNHAYVYEGSPAFILPDGTTVAAPGKDIIWGYTFADFAGYTIATPPNHWGGTGAPDDLNASSYTAYGFNWVFGDTQTNYIGGYSVSDPVATAVPEPVTMLAVFGGLSLLGGYIRRRRTA
jgi:hypothetical protein